jgi:sugar phosphate isomerase/epimerase
MSEYEVTRRGFLRGAAAAAGLGLLGRRAVTRAATVPFEISLAEWSLNNETFAGKRDHLDFAKAAKQEFGLDAVEYVNQFFMDKAEDDAYICEMKTRADGEGVRSLLIMCDREGRLGDPDEAKRAQSVENHEKWLAAAKTLGCHSIRVNAASEGTRAEQVKLAADGLHRLSVRGEEYGLNVIVENHGGLSSDGAWLAEVMRTADHPRCGTLPDFGNFRVDEKTSYDPYKGVAEMMPFAKAVSAKTFEFDEAGNEKRVDYVKMLRIVLDAGYRGHLGIEYEGDRLEEPVGIRATIALLERVREELAEEYA